MKKMLILTAVLALTLSAVGCKSCDSWFRGSSATAATPVMISGSPCDPCAAPCAAPCAPACGMVGGS